MGGEVVEDLYDVGVFGTGYTPFRIRGNECSECLDAPAFFFLQMQIEKSGAQLSKKAQKSSYYGVLT